MPFPKNLLSLALLTYYPIGPKDDRKENHCLKVFLLPLRIVLFVVGMAMAYPLMLSVAVFYAIYARITKGTADEILKTSMKTSYKTGASYPCQFVFTKPLKDEARFTGVVKKMAQECGIPVEQVQIVFESEQPQPFPSSSKVEADHYVTKGWNYFKNALRYMDGVVLGARVWNGSEEANIPTVVQYYLPGHSWDGTSCFNFAKESFNRYYGGEETKLLIRTTLKAEAAEKLRNASFCAFLAKLPYRIFVNTADFQWNFFTTQKFLGGAGLTTELAMLNFNEDDSQRLARGLKRKGVKPYAGFIYAAFHAYKDVLGSAPFGIVQQSSLQSRCYEPVLSKRDFVGDWLVGVMHRFSGREFTLHDAQGVYEELLRSLDAMDGNVLEGAMAKAYCPLAGAAVFQFFPFYGDNCRILQDIFFNNYGTRSIHPDAGLYSWNWGAPFKLGFNTAFVNGKTCICLASSHVNLSKLRSVRDHVHETLQDLMEPLVEEGKGSRAELTAATFSTAQ